MSTRPNLLRGCVAVACALSCTFAAHSQITGIVAEPVAMHSGEVGGSDLTGLTTYRIYAELASPEDFVTAAFGSAATPLTIETTTSFWQHPGGSAVATDLNPFLFNLIPEVAYDSWVTIGAEQAPAAAGVQDVDNIGVGAAFAAFEEGGNLVVNTPAGGSWFVLPGAANGMPDGNNRVLLAQVTTDGLISGTLNAQVFIGGVSTNAEQATFSFAAGEAGCTQAAACNYSASATSDDGSCTYPDPELDCDGECLSDADGDGVCDAFEVAGCEDTEACNFNADATDAGACEYPAAGYDCAGDCLTDTDGDGVCDEFEVAGCTDAEACNFDAAATEDDGSCVGPEAGYNCAGDCMEDTDGDGVCDAFEVPGCTNELATNYDAAATDDDGSCSIDPAAFCGEGTVWDESVGQCVSSGTGDGGVGGYGAPCFGDFYGDGSIGAAELMLFLTVYDTYCE